MPHRIVYPVLNIYVGTSPLEVGRHVNREVQQLDPSDQRKVASLFIDTMPIQEERANGHRTAGSDTMQIMIPRFQASGQWNPDALDNLYVVSGAAHHKPGITAAGAGGIRNNGHVAFCFWASSVMQRISDKLDLINAPPPVEQNQRAAASLRVNIIAFLGGGTGSGVLPALTVLTRYVMTRKNVVPQTAIYAVLPEHPKGSTAAMQRRARSNAFSALLELTTLLRLKTARERQRIPYGAVELEIEGMQVVDIIYLYGHGKLVEHTPVYEHIGMDLFLRMQDGHGAGHERHRQLPDLSGLQEKDSEELPTIGATSGVTEIIFPRADVLGAFARRAARQVVESQTSDLTPVEQVRMDQLSAEIGAALIERLDAELSREYANATPDSFDSDIIDFNEEWRVQLDERRDVYVRQLANARITVLETIKGEALYRIHKHLAERCDAVFARYVRIFEGVHATVRQAASAMMTHEYPKSDDAYEDRLLHPRFPRRRQPGRFAAYANELLDSTVEAARNNDRLLALELFAGWLKGEADQRDSQLAEFKRMTSREDKHPNDRALLEEAQLPYPHVYTRPALTSPVMIEKLYQDVLRWSQLEKNNELDVALAFDHVRKAQRSQDDSLSVEALEQFFFMRFSDALRSVDPDSKTKELRPTPVLEIIERYGGDQLLRTHINWALEWARGHLNYNPYQEEETNGRIARQLDVAMLFNRSQREKVAKIVNEESTRSEVQNGPKLLGSYDPDRISFLYTEYAIPLRAIDGMHEPGNSYVKDYCTNQAWWMSRGDMPPHTSSLMQRAAAMPTQKGYPLVVGFADNKTQIDVHSLYGRDADHATAAGAVTNGHVMSGSIPS